MLVAIHAPKESHSFAFGGRLFQHRHNDPVSSRDAVGGYCGRAKEPLGVRIQGERGGWWDIDRGVYAGWACGAFSESNSPSRSGAGLQPAVREL